ncbi:Fanconi anemia core complex-associated protein 100-like isoform X2 [Asterias rubens]|uniref:Fanconi anemia core complex-associated protein 100-like isoform X2 n=1 Tax=Asterias rubens TaxID=7604 RepID=UPI001455037D|nr:Fanconi anemia core complex-associated protein 100-like isoform X2 [Asterias rubens]
MKSALVPKECIVHLPSNCRCMCVSRDPQGEEHLIFCLKDGRILKQSVQSFTEETRSKKKKKKKDKHKGQDRLMEVVADPLPKGGDGDCPPRNQDIFGDLLSEANPSSSAAQPMDIIQDEFIAKVVVLGDDHVIFIEPNVQDVMFVNGCLIFCAECTSGWTISLYYQRANGQHVKGLSQPNGTTSHDASTKHFEFDKSPAFKTLLPGRQIDVKSQGSSSFFNSERPIRHTGETSIEDEPNVHEKPQLFCVISQSMSGNSFATLSKTLTIDDGLYNTLFGSETNLLGTPVILTSLPDGHIYQSPLRPSNRSNPYPARSNTFSLRTSLFFVSDQPVAFIHGLRAVPNETEQNNSASSCMCILGRYGRVVCIAESSHDDQPKKFTESFIHGPVQTACKTRTHQEIMYSTGKEIYCLSLSNSKKSDSSTTKDTFSCSSVIGVAEIRALAELGRPKTDVNGSSQLVALTVSGNVLKVNLRPVGSRGNTIQPIITAAAAGKRVQESLQAINNISSRSHELAKLSHAQDQILPEMSKAFHLSSMLLSECKVSGSSGMFTLDAKCAFRNNGMMCDTELLCKVTNHSQWSLSHGWALTVSMETASEWTQVAEGAKYNMTKSVQLVDFQPNQTVEVILPLLNREVCISLPVNVQTFLHFSPREYISSLLPEKNMKVESHTNLEESGILLPLNKPRVIDLMTVLRPVQDDAAGVQGNGAVTRQCQTTTNSGSDWLDSALQDTARLRHSTYQGARSTRDADDKSVDVCITLRSDVTTMILEKRKNHGNSRQVQVLRWLLEDNTFTTQSTNPLSLRTPDGKVVTFEVKGQQQRQGTADGGSEIREAVEVVVRAPDYPTLTQLQLAVNQRIKVLLESEGSQVGINTTQKQLQNELGKVQILRKNLQSLQDAVIRDQLSSTQWHAKSTLELYQQLRTRLTFM